MEHNEELYREIDLKDQVVIVTGGGRGIGRAIALELAKAGAAIAVVARTEAQLNETVALVEKVGCKAFAYPADVTDRQAVEQMVASVERQLGPADMLVNNAGYCAKPAPIWEADPDEWWKCIDINLRGPFLCSRAVLPGMISRSHGRIITTASSAGARPYPYLSAYAISKCGAIRLTEQLALEASEHGIKVFAINPGLVRTTMTEIGANSPEDLEWLGGKFHQSLAEGLDIPADCAARLVALLASGKADVLSGCFITVKDDVGEMLSRASEIQDNELYTLRVNR